MSASSQPEPRSMKWESSGELAQRDLSELVTRLLDVESSNNGDELTRLSSKYDGESENYKYPLAHLKLIVQLKGKKRVS